MSLRPGSSSGSPSNARRKMYKTGFTAEDGRRRREKDLVSIRKNKRRSTLLKKREETPSFNTVLEAVPEIVKCLCEDFPHKTLEATAHLRTILTLGEPAPPIDEIIKHGILPRFVELLSRDDSPHLQIEVLWVISNFSSTTPQHKRAVVEVGVVPLLVNLVSGSKEDIREEAIWILGSIVSDSSDYRDYALNNGALMPLLHRLQPHSPLHIVRAATWCLSVLLRGIPPVNPDVVKLALPVLQRLIYGTDEDIVADACWSLVYVSEEQIDNIQAIVELGLCPKLVELLQYPSDTVILPALEALGNIAAGGEAQTQLVIDNQLLPCLHQLLTREYTPTLFKEACWTLEIITAGTKAHVQAVIDANIIPDLVKVVRNAEFEVKREAVYAIYNVTSKGSLGHIRVLVAEGSIEALCELLSSLDPKLVRICMEALVNILAVGEAEKDNDFVQRVEQCGGLDKIETLHLYENKEINTRAEILSDFFREDSDLEDTNMNE